MSIIRPASVQTQHQRFASLTKEWTPDFGEGSLSKYLLKQGITHLFKLDALIDVRERLLNLAFFSHLYEILDYPEILKYWRVLGEKQVGERYENTVTKSLSEKNDDLNIVMNFIQISTNFL